MCGIVGYIGRRGSAGIAVFDKGAIRTVKTRGKLKCMAEKLAAGILFRDFPDRVYVARKGSPLIVGLGGAADTTASPELAKSRGAKTLAIVNMKYSTTAALRLIAYYTALFRGNDPDKPRNLAKSVTTE